MNRRATLIPEYTTCFKKFPLLSIRHYFYGGIVVCAYPIFCLQCSCCCFFFLNVRAAMRFLSVAFGLPYLLIELFDIGMPVVRTDGRAVGRSVYGHVITKFSRMGSLPHFFTHGAPLRALRARAPLKSMMHVQSCCFDH